MTFGVVESKDLLMWKEDGLEVLLTCGICNAPLKRGDVMDTLFPYHSERNRCKRCLQKDGKASIEEVLLGAIRRHPDLRDSLTPVLEAVRKAKLTVV